MTSRIPFIPGLGAGHVLGIRIERAQYERIKAVASEIAGQPFARTRVDAASSHVKQAVHTQGKAITKKVAGATKEWLFRTPPSKDGVQSQPIDAGQASVRLVGENS